MSDADAENVAPATPDQEEGARPDETTGEAWRVVLRDGDPTALVRTPDEVVDNVPILTAKRDEDPEDVTRDVDHDHVLLKEGDDVARVRIKDRARADVPIYKERADAGDDEPKEMRVRVREIREHEAQGNRKQMLRGLFKRS